MIIAVNGQQVKRLAALTNEIERVGVGKSVALTLRRGEETTTVSVTTEDIGPR